MKARIERPLKKRPPTAITIAGSDSSGGAGIQADLRTFTALGVFGASAITAVTAQNTVGVRQVHALPADVVSAQIEAVLEDFEIDAAKTGMLANERIVRAVAGAVRRFGIDNLVVDPVTASQTGHSLLDEGALKAMTAELLPLAEVTTPNLYEAAALAGVKVEDPADMREAARLIHSLGSRYVVVKGGHLAGEPIDVVYDGQGFWELTASRAGEGSAHGTGCTFSAAICAGLARGDSVKEAIENAKQLVALALTVPCEMGRGERPVNQLPWLEHLWRQGG